MAYYNLGIADHAVQVDGDYAYYCAATVTNPDWTGTVETTWMDGSTSVTSNITGNAVQFTSPVTVDMSAPAEVTKDGKTYEFVAHVIRYPGGSVEYNTTAACGRITFDHETTASSFVFFFTAYRKKTYTITFKSHDTAGNMPAPLTVDAGAEATIPQTVPTRSGFTFDGWTRSGTTIPTPTVDYLPGDTFTPEHSMSLWAVWSEYVPPTPSGTGSGLLACVATPSGSLAFSPMTGSLVYN